MKSNTKMVLLTTLDSVIPFYIIIGTVNGLLEEINRYRYLTVVPINESKEIMTKIQRTVD